MASKQNIVVLGNEYDDELRKALIAVLRDKGALTQESSWNVVGSQEIGTVEAELEGEHITIESETYIGLTVTGPRQVVEELVKAVRERMAAENGNPPIPSKTQ